LAAGRDRRWLPKIADCTKFAPFSAIPEPVSSAFKRSSEYPLSNNLRSLTKSLFNQLKTSFTAAIGDIVFGMEDGTVSIFGLVAGVALSAESGKQVLLAGASGAIAAAVSMMAGVFLDLQSERDQEKVETKQRRAAIQANPQRAIAHLMGRLQYSGLSPATLNAIQAEVQASPFNLLSLESAFKVQTSAQQQKPVGHAIWMFFSDLFAGLTPVLAFVFLPLAQARWVSLGMTVLLLIALGYGRARIGQRAIVPTVLQTVGVAGLAAIAGVAIGQLIDTHVP
jgi:VIT1/CCC1 family predicted Fe2+/Mn2+ transporter